MCNDDQPVHAVASGQELRGLSVGRWPLGRKGAYAKLLRIIPLEADEAILMSGGIEVQFLRVLNPLVGAMYVSPKRACLLWLPPGGARAWIVPRECLMAVENHAFFIWLTARVGGRQRTLKIAPANFRRGTMPPTPGDGAAQLHDRLGPTEMYEALKRWRTAPDTVLP